MSPDADSPARDFTRRDALRLGGSALLGTVLPASDASATAGVEEFRFVVATDLHYRDARCGEWLMRVAAHVRALRPRPAFVVLGGDLSEDGTRAQLGAVHEIFRALPMPVHSIIGNHDYDLDGRCGEYERLHGPRLNYRFEHDAWQFLALDTTQGRSVYRTRISAGTLQWLDATLPDLSTRRPLVVLTHFPLGRNWLRPINARAVLDRLRAHDLRAVFSGHWHGLTERRERGASLVTGRCCSHWRGNHDGSDQKGYLLCSVRGGAITRGFVPVA